MSTPAHPLLVVLVHGIGPQDSTAQVGFLDRLRAATAARLAATGRADLAPRLVLTRADWSHLFTERRAWLAHLFPGHAGAGTRCRRILVMLLWALVVPVIATIGAGLGVGTVPPAALGWIVGTAAGFAAAALVAWNGVLPWFPWGHLWTFGRKFEADTVSDLILYESDAPREEILKVVLNVVEPYLGQAYPLDKEGRLTALPVVLVGHSLGTVVAYDVLLGIAARSRHQSPAVERELRAVQAALLASQRGSAPDPAGASGPSGRGTAAAEPRAVARGLHDRLGFLERARRVQDILYPVGMATMGSPIALFLFRKPALLDDTDLWRTACPAAFAQSGALETPAGALRWRWQNFWHPSDFVAHRLEPLFNTGYPMAGPASAPAGAGSKFVEDVKTSAWARSPVSAHSTYWTNPAVLTRIAAQLAEVLTALP
jgi:hypothetical protein